eukprot:3603769-Amphidinium_carterae.1
MEEQPAMHQDLGHAGPKHQVEGVDTNNKFSRIPLPTPLFHRNTLRQPLARGWLNCDRCQQRAYHRRHVCTDLSCFEASSGSRTMED